MKFIIDISENDLDNFLNKCVATTSFINSIANFITLDSVINNVKAKIEEMPTDYCGGYIGLDKKEVLQIIDNIGKESEVKPNEM